MGIAASVSNVFLMTDLVNNTNILVIYLSMVVLFFLLGLVLGLTIGTRKRIPKDVKDKKAPEMTVTANRSKQIAVPVPNIQSYGDQQLHNTNYTGRSHRHRRHRRFRLHIH